MISNGKSSTPASSAVLETILWNYLCIQITYLRLSKEYESLRPPVENFIDSIFPTAHNNNVYYTKEKKPAQI